MGELAALSQDQMWSGTGRETRDSQVADLATRRRQVVRMSR